MMRIGFCGVNDDGGTADVLADRETLVKRVVDLCVYGVKALKVYRKRSVHLTDRNAAYLGCFLKGSEELDDLLYGLVEKALYDLTCF